MFGDLPPAVGPEIDSTELHSHLAARPSGWQLNPEDWRLVSFQWMDWMYVFTSNLCLPSSAKKNDLPTYLSMVQIADHHKNGFWQWRVEHGKHMSSQSGLSILPHNQVVTKNIPVAGFIPSQQTNMYNKYISSHC